MCRFLAVLLGCSFALPAALHPVHGGDDFTEYTLNFDDFGVGETVERLEPAGITVVGGSVVMDGLPTDSASHHLARRDWTKSTAAGDPDALVLLLDKPANAVSFCVGNPTGVKGLVVTLRAYDSPEATKPVVIQTVEPGMQPGVLARVSLCRMLEADLRRIEIESSNGGVEVVDSLRIHRFLGSTTRIDFEDAPAGTIVLDRYPGVRFPEGPEIVSEAAVGVPVRSPGQALRQRIGGEVDTRPLVMTFQPPQGSVRVHVGYPAAEDNGGTLRVVFRAFGGEPKAPVLATEQEVVLSSGTPVRVPLSVCRPEMDIHRVEVWFDRGLGGHEVVDDLEFGPRTAGGGGLDTLAPQVLIESPQEGDIVPQPGPEPMYSTTTIRVSGRVLETNGIGSALLEVVPGDGSARYVDPGFAARLAGAGSPYRFDIPVLLSTGTNLLRLQVTDVSGNVGTSEIRVIYRGPEPVEGLGSSPGRLYPERVFRDASGSGESMGTPDPVVELTVRNFHERCRVYLIPESVFSLTPSTLFLTEAPILSRDPSGTSVRVRVPAGMFERPGRYVWLIWDTWTRPGAPSWIRAGDVDLRNWSYPALWSMGFRNRDETNGIAEFEAVFGNDMAPGFLETTSDLNGCARGTSAVRYFLDTFDPGMNDDPGSCYGYAAWTQLFASGLKRPESFDAAVHHPSAFFAIEPMLFRSHACDPAVPLNLWAEIQTAYGVQYSFEDLRDWSDQVEWDEDRWVGDPLRVANELRGAESQYTVVMLPDRMDSGHVVAPYRVEDRDPNTVRIWVVDSNFPYDIRQPEEAIVNRVALNRFIDIDRRSNTFRFSIGASDNADLEYQGGTNILRGQGLSLTRIERFLNPRTIPGLNLWWHQAFGLTGDARPEMEIPGQGTFGWNAAGEFASNLGGIHPFVGFRFAGEPTIPRLILARTNATEVLFHAHATGSAYRFSAVGGGVTLALDRTDALPGTGDAFHLESSDGQMKRFGFKPASNASAFTPVTIATDGKSFETTLEWLGLKIEANERVDFGVDAAGTGGWFKNQSLRSLQVHLAFQSSRLGGGASVRRLFGPFEVPPEGELRVVTSTKPGETALLAGIDLNGDGKPEEPHWILGEAIQRKPGDTGDCNGNGTFDRYDIVTGLASDLNQDGWLDGCNIPPEACPPDGAHRTRFNTFQEGRIEASAIPGVRLLQQSVVRDGRLEPELSSSDPALPAGLRIRFGCPRDFVRVELAAAADGSKASGKIRLYGFSSEDATKPVAIAERLLPAGGETNRWMEIRSPLDRNIETVELVADAGVSESIETLEHGTWTNRVVTRIDFEELPTGTPVEFQYPGVRVLDAAEIIGAETLGVSVGSGTQALRRRTDTVLDPQPLRLRLIPPQMAVRLKVGFPESEDGRSPLRVILRGFDFKGALLTSETQRLVNPVGIQRTIGLQSRGENRLSIISIEYVPELAELTSAHPGFEVIDDLEFGPLPPGALVDRTAPVVTIDSPGAGQTVLSTPMATNRVVGLQGRVREANGIARLQAFIVETQSGITNEVPLFDTALNGLAPDYVFSRPIELGLGERRVIVVATDFAGNEGVGEVPLDTAAYPPVLLQRGTNLLGLDYILREPFNGEWDPMNLQALGDFEEGAPGWWEYGGYDALRVRSELPRLQGENFHDRLRVFLVPTNNVTGGDPATWSRVGDVPLFYRVSADRSVLEPTVPWSVTTALGSRWRWLVQDPYPRPGAVEWQDGGAARVVPEPVRLHGFPFVNRDDTVGLGMFDTTFGESVYLPTPFCSLRDPLALITYPVFKIWMDNTRGSCVGFAATSQLLLNGVIEPSRFVPGVNFAGGLYPREWQPTSSFPLPEVHENPACSPRTPANLWAYIRGMQGVQTSSEFVAAWGARSQVDGFISVGGNPREVLDRVRGNPADYVICIVPAVGRGHAVAPYEVVDLDARRSRIRVYDPNLPSVRLGSRPAFDRQRAASQFIEIDREANTYEFYLSGRTAWEAGGQGERWSGNGVYAIPLSVWRGQRHWLLSIQGLAQLVFFPFFLGAAGDGTLHIQDGAREWGWREDGTFVDQFPGVFAPGLVGAAGQAHSNILATFSVAPEHPVITLHSQGGEYHLATATTSTVWDLKVRNGDGTRFEPRMSNGKLRGFTVHPVGAEVRLTPTVGSVDGATNRLVYRIAEFLPPAGAGFGMEMDAATGGIRIENGSDRALSLRILVESLPANSGLRVLEVPLGEVPGQAVLGVRPIVEGDEEWFELTYDTNADGQPESSRRVLARVLSAPMDRGSRDDNNNGVLDAVDIALGRSSDTNTNGVPDELETAEGGVQIRVDFADEDRRVLRVRVQAAVDATVVLESGSTLGVWMGVGQKTAVNGWAEFEVERSTSAQFFRAFVK